MEQIPNDWPYADEPRVCAACGSDDDRYVTVDSLGLVWGAAMGGPDPTDVGDLDGTLEFRCCADCWTERGVDALDDARTLLEGDGRGQSLALDDEKVSAAATLDANRVAVGDLRELSFRSEPEREHVRAQDEAIEELLAARRDDA